MKRQILSVIFVAILAIFFGPLSAICEVDNNTHLINHYVNFINEKISKCHSKAKLIESKSVHLQNRAAKEIKKAVFLNENRESLIKEMVKRDIGAKQYKIESFLNNKFHEHSDIADSWAIIDKTL